MTSSFSEPYLGVEVQLTRLETNLMHAGAARTGVPEREWMKHALVHYDRWQQLWAGPAGPSDGHAGEVELFATLVERAPACLHGRWQVLHDVVRLNSALWAWPTQSLDEYEEGVEPTRPHLDRAALAKVWPRLKSLVSHAASVTAKGERVAIEGRAL